MAILRMNADEGGRVFDPSGGDWRARLSAAVATCPDEAPIVVLLHGLRYSWRQGRGCDPHSTLYVAGPLPASRRIRPDRVNWPHLLGFREDGVADGVCVAFGWDAGRLSDIRNAPSALARASDGLTAVIEAVASMGRRADCLGHSLGAALPLSAMRARPGLPVRRVLMLGPAERRGAALAAVRAQSGREKTEFVHMLARANDVFDEAYHRFAPTSPEGCARPLGAAGLGEARPEWLDLQIDHPLTRRWISRWTQRPERRPDRVSHWLFYSDEMLMALYGRILRDPSRSIITALRDGGAPDEIAPRWSRLRPRLARLRASGRGDISAPEAA